MKTFLAFLLSVSALMAGDVPRRAPGFALLDLKGQIHDLADYRGKVVVLEFMQSTCPHCAGFVEILQKAQQRYGDKIAILAVGNPPADNAATLNQYVAGHHITYPVMFDCGQMAYSYVLKGNIDLPTVYVIDGGGTIRGEHSYGPLERGFFEGNDLFGELDRMLSMSPAPLPKKK
jgi:thiol-disulfide isomerase/thioredoxin